jgi:signal transduction histidine kinase
MDVPELRRLALFDGTNDEDLRVLLTAGEDVAFRSGEEVFLAGQPTEHWWVLLEGRLDLVRTTGQGQVVVSSMDVPGQWIGAVGAWDDDAVHFLTGRGAAAGRLLRVPTSALRRLSSSRFPLGDHLIEGLVTTLRRVESTIRDKEALVGLGTLAAGLAHELNNPAAAAQRAVSVLAHDWDAMLAALQRLAAGSTTADQFGALDALRRELAGREPVGEPMAVADLEESLTACLSAHGVDRPWSVAPVLARAGADVTWCDRIAAVLGGALAPGLDWVASTLSAGRSLEEAAESAGRISDLVAAVKSYTQLDRAALQRVDVHEGLDSTLAVMAHRIPAGVTIVRSYDSGLPEIQAAAAELNQVWTNLVDNALDAMGDEGTLRLVTRIAPDGVVVEVGDSGPGMPPEVRLHAFDPFFTTKGVGRGTGLGLDISRRIVERHRGEIGIDSSAAGTVLRVRLPLTAG